MGTEVTWADAVTAVTAVIALGLSIYSLRQSSRSLKLSELQDARHRPNLIGQIEEGDYTSDEDGSRTYWVSVSIGNRSDADNALARVELRIEYRVTDVPIVARIPAAPGEGTSALPAKIDAYDTLRLKASFCVPAELAQQRIERHVVEFRDTHGHLISVEPLLLSERRA